MHQIFTSIFNPIKNYVWKKFLDYEAYCHNNTNNDSEINLGVVS
jgi:hypothetical protein